MERNRDFLRLSLWIILSGIFIVSLPILAAIFLSDHAFRLILFMVSTFIFIIILLMILGFLKVQTVLSHPDNHPTTRKKPLKGWRRIVIRLAFRFYMPFLLMVSESLNYKKDEIRRAYIKANNAHVLSVLKKADPGKVLVILPHCLQNSKCGYRLNHGLEACRQCASCSIGDIKAIVKQYGINTRIATGGTSARNIIREFRPEFVIAVACERDLSSGIVDMTGIPVYGILNQRPNGPCKDTFVDVNELRRMIEIITNKTLK